jgi:hypothetical protein
MLSLRAYVAWFLRKYVWSREATCYKDVLGCVMARMDIVTQAAIYEAVTAKPYGDPTRMYLESACIPCAWTDELYTRAGTTEYAPAMVHPSQLMRIIHTIEPGYRFKKWVIQFITAGNLPMLQALITALETEHIEIATKRDIMSCAVKADRVDAVLMVHKAFGHNRSVKINEYTLMPNTHKLMVSLGYKVDVRMMRSVLNFLERGLAHTHQNHSIHDLCGHALEHGVALDYICKRLTIEDMVNCKIADSYHNNTLAWFLRNGIRLTQLNPDIFGTDNVLWCLSRTDEYSRAWLLAKVSNAMKVYKHLQFTYHAATFHMLANARAIAKMEKHVRS